jgi:hypothetical protein
LALSLVPDQLTNTPAWVKPEAMARLNWDTGMSYWPLSHILVPVCIVVLMADTMSVAVRVAVVAALAVTVEIIELPLKHVGEDQGDMSMDVWHGLLGALIGLGLVYGLGMAPMGVLGARWSVGGWALALVAIAAFGVCSTVVCSTGQWYDDIASSVAPPGESAGYVVPWNALLLMGVVVAFSGVAVYATGASWHWPGILALVTAALAAPLFVQGENDERLLSTTLIGCGLAAVFLSSAGWRHRKSLAGLTAGLSPARVAL